MIKSKCYIKFKVIESTTIDYIVILNDILKRFNT